jgi:hypothetical protein
VDKSAGAGWLNYLNLNRYRSHPAVVDSTSGLSADLSGQKDAF